MESSCHQTSHSVAQRPVHAGQETEPDNPSANPNAMFDDLIPHGVHLRSESWLHAAARVSMIGV